MTNQRLMAQYGFVLPGGNPADRLAFATLPGPGEGSESDGSEQESAAAAGGGALLSLDRMQVGSGTWPLWCLLVLAMVSMSKRWPWTRGGATMCIPCGGSSAGGMPAAGLS